MNAEPGSQVTGFEFCNRLQVFSKLSCQLVGVGRTNGVTNANFDGLQRLRLRCQESRKLDDSVTSAKQTACKANSAIRFDTNHRSDTQAIRHTADPLWQSTTSDCITQILE